MSLKQDKAYRLSVCIDCYGTDANGSDWITSGDREPFNLIPEADSVTAGWIHDPDEFIIEVEPDDNDNLGFSWSACDACGSPLGGDRYKMTGWEA